MRIERKPYLAPNLHSILNPQSSTLAFTLIEILVVILIISIAVSVIAIPLGSSGLERKMEEIARQLNAVLHSARDQAIFESKEIGLVLDISQREYYFVQLSDDQTWQIITDEPSLKKRSLFAEIEFDLTTEGEKLKLPNQEKGKTPQLQNNPQILLLSSGEITPFELRIHSKKAESEYKIAGQFNGEIKLLRGDREI